MATSLADEIATTVGGVDVGAERTLTLVALAGAGTITLLVAITGAGVFVGGRLVGVSDGVTRLRNGNGSSVVLIAVPLVGVMKTICVGSRVAWAQDTHKTTAARIGKSFFTLCRRSSQRLKRAKDTIQYLKFFFSVKQFL